MYFCIVCCNFSFFISNFVDESGERLVNFVYLLKEPAFSFINLYYCFFPFFFIYFCSDILISFLLLIFNFFVLFPVVLGVKLGCLFDVFLVSWGRIVLLLTSLLELLLLHPIHFELLCFHCHLFLKFFDFPFDFFSNLLVI